MCAQHTLQSDAFEVLLWFYCDHPNCHIINPFPFALQIL